MTMTEAETEELAALRRENAILRSTLRGILAADGPVRSFRTPDAPWEAAQARAKADGTNMSHVLRAFLAQYADELIDMEQHVRYDPPPAADHTPPDDR